MRLFLLLISALLCGPLSAQEEVGRQQPIRFRAVDIFIDPQTQPLAAYQLDFRVVSGRGRIVGIEGGAHPTFAQPPFYDPEAMQHERVVIAAFNTGPAGQLPARKVRVATIHLEVVGKTLPRYSVTLAAAGTEGGKRIKAVATFEERRPK